MVDEGILKRIHALMSKTVEAGCTEEEALAAAQKVQEMLHKHQLSMSDIRIKDEKCVQDGYDSQMKGRQEVEGILNAVAYFTDTKCWIDWTRYGHRDYVFFGLEHDVLIAKYITKICDRAIIQAGEDYRLDPVFQAASKSYRPKLMESFKAGMAARLSSRIRGMKNAQRREDLKTTGRDLVVVKNAVVDEEYAKLNLNLKDRKSRGRTIDGRAYLSGTSAGDKVALNPGVGEGTRPTAMIGD